MFLHCFSQMYTYSIILQWYRLSRRTLWEVKWASGLSWGHIILSHPCDKFQLIIVVLEVVTMASHLNPPNQQSRVCNFSQLIFDIRYAGLTQLLGVKVEIHQLSTLPTSSLRTSSPTSGGPLTPSGSLNYVTPTDNSSYWFNYSTLELNIW